MVWCCGSCATSATESTSVFTFGSLFTFGSVFISSGTGSVFTLGSRPTGPCSILISVFTRFGERWGRGSSILCSLGSAKASAFTFFNPALVSAKGSLQAGGKGRISTRKQRRSSTPTGPLSETECNLRFAGTGASCQCTGFSHPLADSRPLVKIVSLQTSVVSPDWSPGSCACWSPIAPLVTVHSGPRGPVACPPLPKWPTGSRPMLWPVPRLCGLQPRTCACAPSEQWSMYKC